MKKQWLPACGSQNYTGILAKGHLQNNIYMYFSRFSESDELLISSVAVAPDFVRVFTKI